MKQNDLIKIMITKRNQKTKDGKKKFTIFKTHIALIKKGEEEKGKQPMWITLKFVSDLNVSELGRGLLTVKVADISFPRVYEVIEDDKGEKQYPVVWVRNFKAFEPLEKDVENPFITDEPETDETVFDNDENVEELETQE